MKAVLCKCCHGFVQHHWVPDTSDPRLRKKVYLPCEKCGHVPKFLNEDGKEITFMEILFK